MKNAIEWCVSTTVFSQKPVGLITAAASGEKGHEELQFIMKILEAKFSVETVLLISGIKGEFNEVGVLTDIETIWNLDLFSIAFGQLMNHELFYKTYLSLLFLYLFLSLTDWSIYNIMDKKEIIFGAALELFVANGFHGTATSKIAAEAGVANGTLFNYFNTKEELIIALYLSVVNEMDGFIIKKMESHSISKESFQSLFNASISWSLDNPVHYHYLMQFNHSPFFKSVEKIVSNKQEHPLFVLIQNAIDIVLIKQLPVDFIFSLFTAQIDGLHWYIISNDLSEEYQSEFIQNAFEMLWKMIEE